MPLFWLRLTLDKLWGSSLAKTAGDLQVALASRVFWVFRAPVAEIFLGFYCCCLFSVRGNSRLEIISTKYAGSQSSSGARYKYCQRAWILQHRHTCYGCGTSIECVGVCKYPIKPVRELKGSPERLQLAVWVTCIISPGMTS